MTIDVEPYLLLEEEREFYQEYKKFKSHKTPTLTSPLIELDFIKQTQTQSSPIVITAGLRCLLDEIDLQLQLSKEQRDLLKLQLIESKMSKSKWFNIERIGQEQLYEEMDKILQELRNYAPYSGPFLNRVSKKEAPDYFDIIKHPMDLCSMYRKLKTNQYDSKQEFIDDLELIRKNCYQYNMDPNSVLRLYVDCLKEKWTPLLVNIPEVKIRDKRAIFAILEAPIESKPKIELPEQPNWKFSSSIPYPEWYGRELEKRATRLSGIPFGEQPAAMRTAHQMGLFNEQLSGLFFASSYPPSQQLQPPLCLYDQWGDKDALSLKRIRSLGALSFFPSHSNLACKQLIKNIININRTRLLKSKIEFIKSSTEFCKTSLTSDGLAQLNQQTVELSFMQQRHRPIDIAVDSFPLIKKFIALFCANLGFQSICHSSLIIMVNVFYEYFENLSLLLKFVLENCLDASEMEINLTVVVRIALKLLAIHPRDLLLYCRNSIERYFAKLEEVNSHLTLQYEQLLSPTTHLTSDITADNNDNSITGEQGESLESSNFFVTGELDGDDLGLDILGLKELGLPSVIPKGLLLAQKEEVDDSCK